MTQRSRTYLKGVFETGDIPTGTDYADLIDSYVNLEASAEQTMAGQLNLPTVSAASGTINVLAATSATVTNATIATLHSTTLTATGAVFTTAVATNVSGAVGRFGILSATSADVTNLNLSGRLVLNNNTTVSAAGTTQGSATAITEDIAHVFSGADERAVVLPSPQPGRVQFITNSNTTTISIFPNSGSNFVGSAADGSILLNKLGSVYIAHIGASAYAFVRDH